MAVSAPTDLKALRRQLDGRLAAPETTPLSEVEIAEIRSALRAATSSVFDLFAQAEAAATDTERHTIKHAAKAISKQAQVVIERCERLGVPSSVLQ